MRFWNYVKNWELFPRSRFLCFWCSSLFWFLLSFLFLYFFPSIIVSADVVETVDTIYQQAENNGIAEAICKAIDIGKIFMVPLFAIMFCIYGFRAFQGDGAKWSTFITFAIGMAAFNSAGTFLEWFMPKMGLNYGCKCAIERDIRDTNGVIKTYPTGLNYDCSMGTTDYYSLHGLLNGDIGQQAMAKREEITMLKAIVASYESLFNEVDILATKMSEKQSEVNAYRNTYESATAIHSAYNGSDILNGYEQLKSVLLAKQDAMNNAQREFDEVDLQMNKIDAQINELKNKISKQENAVRIAHNNYDDAVTTLNNYKKQNNPNSSSVAVFTSLANNAENILRNEESLLLDYKKELENLEIRKRGKAALFDKDNNMIENEIISLEARLVNVRTALSNVKEEYKQALKNLEEYEMKVEMKAYLTAKNDMSSSLSNYNKSQIEYNNLLTKWQVKKQKLDSMTSSYTEAKSKIATLQVELAQLTPS